MVALTRNIHIKGWMPIVTSMPAPAALKRYKRIHKTGIGIRQCKDLNNIVEQDHRAVKRIVRPMLGFKSFWAARCTIAGIEAMHAIRKGQLASTGEGCLTPRSRGTVLCIGYVVH